VERHFDRTLNQLERLQRMRLRPTGPAQTRSAGSLSQEDAPHIRISSQQPVSAQAC
jgi:hypothetical protein